MKNFKRSLLFITIVMVLLAPTLLLSACGTSNGNSQLPVENFEDYITKTEYAFEAGDYKAGFVFVYGSPEALPKILAGEIHLLGKANLDKTYATLQEFETAYSTENDCHCGVTWRFNDTQYQGVWNGEPYHDYYEDKDVNPGDVYDGPYDYDTDAGKLIIYPDERSATFILMNDSFYHENLVPEDYYAVIDGKEVPAVRIYAGRVLVK